MAPNAFDGDNPRRQAVTALTDAGHVREAVLDLGYSRDVCRECRVNWPCPDWAQAVAGLYDDSFSG